MELIIISGMSGAGKTVALHILEDLGYYCTDNIPPQLMSELAIALSSSISVRHDKVAMVADSRMGQFLSGINDAVDKLKALGFNVRILFLDADDKTILNRYNLSKRKHPMQGNGTLAVGIDNERQLLKSLKDRADYIIDTAKLGDKQLKERIREIFTEGDQKIGAINIISFGFKRGMPIDCDMVYDMRFLPNPYYDDSLKNKTGKDEDVFNYIFKKESNGEKIMMIAAYIGSMAEDYFKNSKEILTIGIGCTGGKHRSVATAEILYRILQKNGLSVSITHRDIEL